MDSYLRVLIVVHFASPVTIIREGTEARQGDQGSATDAEGVEDLRRSVTPNARVQQG